MSYITMPIATQLNNAQAYQLIVGPPPSYTITKVPVAAPLPNGSLVVVDSRCVTMTQEGWRRIVSGSVLNILSTPGTLTGIVESKDEIIVIDVITPPPGA